MITLNPHPLTITDEQFYELCKTNRNLRLERTARGELIIMAPTGGETGKRNSSLTGQLWLWNRQTGLGQTFDSSTGFRLPNGAIRSPDVSWVAQSRWDALSPDNKKGFVPLCPDFVVELHSPGDTLQTIRDKMDEHMTSGAHLGWLIDPDNQRVEIYRQGQAVEIATQPATLSGEAVLPGFVLNLQEILA